ncbi:toxin-antitoxin system YwqK family antitoxin [Labilibaculum sp. K2S]|uniref:toxin-antitoxin system YwqK family antitoxin n=1 Tax=Labilibaculum sp. K2S TaxID=3056386 RepID=UPI0025A481DE|nr:toxin-antitoxin system YwqK family antitoxin [Labilibaculum sp. K2S]MDM8160863.1 toxin-antitoxin system YwqK family antitoxin [Labilibaculum sp. K2S]
MKFTRCFFVFILLLPLKSIAQDTVYFNQDWLVAEKENAQFFSTINKITENQFLVKDFTIDNVLLSEYHYKGLQANIDWTGLYEVGFNKYAIENGPSRYFYSSGSKKKESEFVNGEQKGMITLWHENGKKESEFFAVNNIANGVYTEFFESGEPSLSVKFINDTLNGPAIYYYPNGKISHMGKFKAGIKFGIWTYLSEDGKPVAEELYQNTYFIDGAAIKISFPEGEWYLSEKYKVDGRLSFLFYRLGMNEDENIEDLASCLISLEAVPSDIGLIDYSSHRRRRLSVDVKKVIPKEKQLFSLPQSIAYLGNHTDSSGHERTTIILHSIQAEVGMELILDCSSENYEVLKEEFEYILKSLKK